MTDGQCDLYIGTSISLQNTNEILFYKTVPSNLHIFYYIVKNTVINVLILKFTQYIQILNITQQHIAHPPIVLDINSH